MDDHCIAELARAIRTGESTAVRAVDNCLKRIGALDSMIHAFIHCDRERARQKAEEIDARIGRGEYPGVLAGVPVAVKDNICTTDLTTTCGSRILKPFQSRYDAHVVQRLESAGAVVIGKANLDEFAMGSSTENSAFGPTLNPWDLGRVAGGSSGGPVAAVASHMVPAALGSDTGGSVRQPASFCGVVGLKPSYGRVSRFGLIAFGSSLDQIGPIGHTVQDVALLLSVIAGHDPNDSTSVNAPVPDYLSCLDRPLDGVRVGVCQAYFGDGLDADVEKAVRTALSLMESNGARLVDIDLPHMRFATACYYLIAPAEASSNLARFDGVHYGHRSDAPRDVLQLYTASRGEGFGEEVKRRIMLGTYALSAGYHDEYYLKALRVRTLIKRDFDDAFGKVDVIASPVAPTPAFRLGEKCDDPLAMYLSDVYTISANLAGICAISVPCGFSGGSLPIGLQLMGPSFGEEKMLRVASGFQALTDYHLPTPPALAKKS